MSAEDRLQARVLIEEAVASGARKDKACELLGLSVRTLQRWETNLEDARRGPLTTPFNALTKEERQKLIEVANSSEYANLSPWQIVPQLADKGQYIASESTFYRVLKQENLLAHRSNSHAHKHSKPEELTATSPNEIWSWDITFLKASVKGSFYYLYLPMDVFSRAIVHWQVHEEQSDELAGEMIQEACRKQGILPGQITLHADNGGPMKGATMLATLQWLGVAPSFSRPRVSDDNPFSEAIFKTLKYAPSFPERGFASIEEAKEWVEKFVHWYNNVHLHSGINWVTPASRHDGLDQKILSKRHEVYQKAKTQHPNRWSGNTRNWSPVDQVTLNPGRRSTKSIVGEDQRNAS